MSKAPNYTEAQTAAMVNRYIAVACEPEATRDALVLELANEFKKSERSIRAKLSRENVYVAKTPKAKDGQPAVNKATLAGILSISAGVPLPSAEKLGKEDLKRLISIIETLRDEVADLEIED
jgi:hypothetical protein